jgi:hypothetical protein
LWEEVTRREERRGVLNLITTGYARLSLEESGGMNNVGVNSMGAGSHSVFRYSVLPPPPPTHTLFTVCCKFTKEISPAMLMARRVGLAVKGLTLGG